MSGFASIGSIRTGRSFAMRVKGTSMQDLLIDDGDYAILRPVNGLAEAGRKVVIWRWDEGYTLKVLGTARRIKDGRKLEDLRAYGRIVPPQVEGKRRTRV